MKKLADLSMFDSLCGWGNVISSRIVFNEIPEGSSGDPEPDDNVDYEETEVDFVSDGKKGDGGCWIIEMKDPTDGATCYYCEPSGRGGERQCPNDYYWTKEEAVEAAKEAYSDHKFRR